MTARGIAALCAGAALIFTMPPATAQSTGLPAPIRLHEEWGEKTSTPGTSLIIKESARAAEGYRFRLYVTGAPKGSVFSLIVWPNTQRGPSEIMEGIALDEAGMAICPTADSCDSPSKPNEPLEVSWNPQPGEPIRLGLMSGDLKIYGKIVAIPLRGEDKGCSVEAALITPGAEILAIEGKGFPPGGEITMDSGAEKGPRVINGRADASGRYLGVVQPFKQGSPSGSINVTLKSANCSPTVTIPLS